MHVIPAALENLIDNLAKLPGIGKKTASVVLKHFGSLKNVKKATLTELEQVPSVTKKRAIDIYYFLRSEKGI